MVERTRGKFIVLEGIDGCGKTTQLEALAAWLPTSGLMPQGAELITTRAPGGTALGQRLRELLLHPPGDTAPCPKAELLLYAADSAQLCHHVIGPALAAGHWVLCDGIAGSTVAYQGYGRGHDLVLIQQLNQLAAGGAKPDLTFWLDLPPAEALHRRGHRHADRIEAAGDAFLGLVADGYLLRWPRKGWRRIDASQPVEAVTTACQLALQNML